MALNLRYVKRCLLTFRSNVWMSPIQTLYLYCIGSCLPICYWVYWNKSISLRPHPHPPNLLSSLFCYVNFWKIYWHRPVHSDLSASWMTWVMRKLILITTQVYLAFPLFFLFIYLIYIYFFSNSTKSVLQGDLPYIIRNNLSAMLC